MMVRSILVSLLALGILASVGPAQETDRDQKTKREEEKAKQIESGLQLGQTVTRMLLQMAERDAKAKQKPEDEQKFRTAQSVAEVVFTLGRQWNKSSLESKVREIRQQDEEQAQAKAREESAHAEAKAREAARLRDDLEGVLDVYVEMTGRSANAPFLRQVTFDGVTVVLEREMLRFRKDQADETWVVDPARIVAIRKSNGETSQAVGKAAGKPK
jgi:hypothetical protein